MKEENLRWMETCKEEASTSSFGGGDEPGPGGPQ
jgi:hypothetical protein